jgi:outer membrane cobalamin receptor
MVQIREGVTCRAVSAMVVLAASMACRLHAQTPAGTTPAASVEGVLRGVVIDANSGEPIAAAQVTLAGTPLRALTSLQGHFVLLHVPVGRYQIDVRRLGYVPLRRDDVVIPTTDVAPLRLALVPVAFQLAAQTVSPGSFAFADAPGGAPQTLTRTDIETAPFGEDLFRAMSRLPGLSSGDYGAQFSIRGGRQDETLILLDGMEIREPFHLKDFNEGALSIFNVDAIDRVELLTGGFSSQYGDKRSGVMLISSRAPRPGVNSVTAGVSLAAASVLSEGHFAGDRGSWIVSGRSGFAGLLLRVINKAETRAPTYQDLFGSARYAVRPNHTLALNALYANDGYRFDIRGTTGFNDSIRTTERANNGYGNSYVWATLHSIVGPYVRIRTITSVGRVSADRAGDERRAASNLSLYEVLGRRTFSELGLKQDYALEGSARALVNWGYDVRKLHANYDWLYRVTQNPDNPVPDTTGFYPRETRRSRLTNGSSVAAYVSSRLRVAEPLTLELGVRYDGASYSGDHDWSPRLHGLVRLTDRNTLRVGWGLYSQRQGIADENAFTGSNRYFRSELSRQWSASVDHRFSGTGSVRVEAYHRRGSRLRPIQRNWKSGLNVFPESAEDRILVFPDAMTSQGVELYVERTLGARVNVRGGYAYAYANERVSRIDQINDPLKPAFAVLHPNPQDQRHAVNADVNVQVSSNWTVNGALTLHTGWPYTSESGIPVTRRNGSVDLVVRPDSLYGARLPLYHRIDVRVTRRRSTATGEFRVFAEVINLLNHENVLGYDVFRERDAAGTLRAVRTAETWFSILPSVGVSWTRRF